MSDVDGEKPRRVMFLYAETLRSGKRGGDGVCAEDTIGSMPPVNT